MSKTIKIRLRTGLVCRHFPKEVGSSLGTPTFPNLSSLNPEQCLLPKAAGLILVWVWLLMEEKPRTFRMSFTYF